MFHLRLFMCLGVLFMCCGCGHDSTPAPGPAAPFETPAPPAPLPQVRQHAAAGGAEIVFEAESAETIEPPMVVAEDADASGGKVLSVPGGSGKPDEEIPGEAPKKYPSRWGAATFKFTVAEAGKYRLWGRKYWEDGCGNSFTLVINGGLPVTFGEDGTYDAWEWLRAPLFDLKSGENTLEVLNREDGVRLDKIILTRDLDFVPQGKE